MDIIECVKNNRLVPKLVLYFIHKEGGDHMPTNEKEINCYLFDQLTLLERIERQAKTGDINAVQDEITLLKKEVERKLYQQPPLIKE